MIWGIWGAKNGAKQHYSPLERMTKKDGRELRSLGSIWTWYNLVVDWWKFCREGLTAGLANFKEQNQSGSPKSIFDQNFLPSFSPKMVTKNGEFKFWLAKLCDGSPGANHYAIFLAPKMATNSGRENNDVDIAAELPLFTSYLPWVARAGWCGPLK